jgi:hypothetical protein
VCIYIWSHNGSDMIKDVEQTKHLLKKTKTTYFGGPGGVTLSPKARGFQVIGSSIETTHGFRDSHHCNKPHIPSGND